MDTPNSSSNEPPAAPEMPPQASKAEVVREIHHYHHPRGGIWRLFFGLLFVVFGLGFLAQNFGWVSGIDFGYFFSVLWPVFIILIGLSIMSRGTWVGATLSSLLVLAVMVILFFSFFWTGNAPKVETRDFSIARAENIDRAYITVKSGASSVNITGGSEMLVSGSLESNITSLHTDSENTAGTQKVNVEARGGNMRFFPGKFVNSLKVALTEALPVDLTVDAGASQLNFDLAGVEVENLNIHSGASSLNVIMGDKAMSANVTISAGASSINLTLPKGVGAKLTANASVSSKNFIDFKQTGTNEYETDNYQSAEKKMDIQIFAGVSSISVNWR